MALYVEFFKKAFQEKYAFRLDFYISIFASIILLAIQINVWSALYDNKIEINHINLREMLNYAIIATIVMTLTRSGSGRKIAERVENGNIVLDLMKPVHFKRYLFSEDLGTNIFQVLFITVPAVLVVWLVYDISVIGSPVHTIFFLISLALGVGIAFQIHYIFGLFAFWLETSWYIPFFIGAMFELFSGSIVPLWFYPDWLYDTCQLLPFRFIFFEPISIFLGKYEFKYILHVILSQLGWLAVIVLIEKYVWLKVHRKLVIHGG